jgi:phage tail-like protein
MVSRPDSSYRYLNREGRWLDFKLHGLVIGSDGALRLPSLPVLAGTGPDSNGAAEPKKHAGIAVAPDGQVFYSVPDANEVRTTGGCYEETVAVSAPEGDLVLPLHAPGGLLIPRERDVLGIADTGNDRVIWLDRATCEVREIWGEFEPGLLRRPTMLAGDGDGFVYILDYANRRVRKFDVWGRIDDDFEANVRSGVPHPYALAATGAGADARVYVLDRDSHTISAFDSAGHRVKTPAGDWFSISAPLEKPFAICATSSELYVGDNGLLRIVVFSAEDGSLIGEAGGWDGPVAAMTIDPKGRILVLLGDGNAPLALSPTGAWASQGAMWSSSISGGGARVAWRQIRSGVDLPPGTHIQLFYTTRDKADPIPVDPAADVPFDPGVWTAVPPNADDIFVPRDPAIYLFVGALLLSDGTATPVLHQMRADFSPDPLYEHLPAFYRNTAPPTDFMRRLTALYGSVLAEIEEEIGAKAAAVDPLSIGEGDLPWLASWLAVDLDPDAPLAVRRQAIVEAFRNDGRRGTPQGFKAAMLVQAGVHVTIDEPLADASWFVLPGETSCGGSGASPGAPLGVGTGLGAAEPFGAILGSTAQFEHSHLITDEEAGAPLFEPSAYRFTVRVHRAEARGEARIQKIRGAIEREKPAHTVARLEIIEPIMRVGAQSRLGIDTVVASVPRATALGSSPWRVGGEAEPRTGSARLGRNLRI